MNEGPPPRGDLRPARVQVEAGKVHAYVEGKGEYNIWYHRYYGQGEPKQPEAEKEAAETRCNIALDHGWTRGYDNKDTYCCIYFAKGCCYLGPECNFLHVLPTRRHDSQVGMLYDCFGRERHRSDKWDMTGIGNFNRTGRILFIANLVFDSTCNMNEVIYRNFAEWGELEYVRLFPKKGFAFLKYRLRVSAEFAKEAMDGQRLQKRDGEELKTCIPLDIRWAMEEEPDEDGVMHLTTLATVKHRGVDIKLEKEPEKPKDFVPPQYTPEQASSIMWAAVQSGLLGVNERGKVQQLGGPDEPQQEETEIVQEVVPEFYIPIQFREPPPEGGVLLSQPGQPSLEACNRWWKEKAELEEKKAKKKEEETLHFILQKKKADLMAMLEKRKKQIAKAKKKKEEKANKKAEEEATAEGEDEEDAEIAEPAAAAAVGVAAPSADEAPSKPVDEDVAAALKFILDDEPSETVPNGVPKALPDKQQEKRPLSDQGEDASRKRSRR